MQVTPSARSNCNRFCTATLGVPVLDYAPYAFFNYLNPLVSIVLAAFWSKAVWQAVPRPVAD